MATILIIDDSQAHRGEIRGAIEGVRLFDRVLEAADGLRGLRMLLAEPVDVVLCDLELPGLDGDKLLRVKDRSPGGSNIPFIFLTASSDVDRRARLLDGGACDTISKPFHPADLVARLRLHLKVKRLQDELLEKNAALAKLSTVDALTGLRSRRYMDDVLAIEFLRSRRYKTPLALVMADLDHFKEVNDAHGHPAGDAVLRGVADLLREGLRASDVGGRYGGEELVVLLPQNGCEGAAVVAERWRAAVEGTRFEVPGGGRVSVTISVGVTECRPEIDAPDDLVAAADAALYRAKERGRNRVEIG